MAALAGCSSGSTRPPNSSSTTVAPAALPQLDSCGTGAVRPATFTIACADGNIYVDHTRWSSWTTVQAVGMGDLVENDCQPYCAAGHFHSYPAKLTLRDPLSAGGPASAAPSGRDWSSLVVAFSGRGPSGARRQTYEVAPPRR